MQTFPISVKGFSPETNENTLFHHFKSCGRIRREEITISHSVGYIQFIQHVGQMNALKMNQTLIGEHKISVRVCK